jgi:uncharacterized membrane protein YfcA
VAFTVAAAAVALWIGAAVVIAHRRRAPVLWRRATLAAASIYAAGALLGAWPWQQGRPLLDLIIRELGG